MAKKKSSTSLIVKIILLVLAALMVVSIFTDLVTIKTEIPLTKDTTYERVTGQDTFETMFEGHDDYLTEKGSEGKNKLIGFAKGDTYEDSHKFVVVMLEICFVVAIIAGIACLVLSLLSLLGINLGIIHKIVALVFMLASVLTFIFALIVSNVMVKDGLYNADYSNGMPGVGAWFALICGLGYGATYIATSRK